MMRVIVEIHPKGDSSAKREIASFDIANITELSPYSDYLINAKLDGVIKRRTFVRNHLRAAGWMVLVRRCLEALEKFPSPGRSP